MKAKAVIKDVARVLGMPFGDGDRISKLVPDELGITLDQAIEKVRRSPRRSGRARRRVRQADALRARLEGMARHAWCTPRAC